MRKGKTKKLKSIFHQKKFWGYLIIGIFIGLFAILVIGKGEFFANVNNLKRVSTKEDMVDKNTSKETTKKSPSKSTNNILSHDEMMACARSTDYPFCMQANNTYFDIIGGYHYAYTHDLIGYLDFTGLYEGLSRIELIEIMIQYASNLGVEPDDSIMCHFEDIHDGTHEYDVALKGCMYGLIGINEGDTGFIHPDDAADRGFFGTLLSRVLNNILGNDVSVLNNMTPYYTGHLAYLQNIGVFGNVSPYDEEIKGHLFLILMESDPTYQSYESQAQCTAEQLLNCLSADNYYSCIFNCSGNGQTGNTNVCNTGDYVTELIQAYNYAYHHGLTTMSDICNADMYGNITRLAFIRMMNIYAENVYGITPDPTKVCTFSDVPVDLDAQYDYAVKKACQLGLVGISEGDGTLLHPNNILTRHFFGTMLSRVLNRNNPQYGTLNNMIPYYIGHLQYLEEQGLINNTNPNLEEVRGYIFLTLMKADETYHPGLGCTAEQLLACLTSPDYSACIANCSGNQQTGSSNNCDTGNYDTQLVQAYNYAYSHGLTTKPNICDANMYGNLTRAQFLPIINTYAENVFGITPDSTKVCTFSDISPQFVENNGTVAKACQLGLIGINEPDNNALYLNDLLTRAYFGTVLSRILNRNSSQYDILNNMIPYYTGHLDYLQDEGLINNTNPDILEVIGYMFLTLMRADETYVPDGGCTADELLACLQADDYDTCIANCGN